MRDALFHLRRAPGASIHSQIREMLVSAILDGQLPPGEPLPSSRNMAKTLGVARGTVASAYRGLADDGYLTAKDRSGFYVSGTISQGRVDEKKPEAHAKMPPRWNDRITKTPGRHHYIRPPANWADYPYPFVYGQTDPSTFPLAPWRDCSRQALSEKDLGQWIGDQWGGDDPLLIEQIQTHLLPRRGIQADKNQILVTLGAQNALHVLACLLMTAGTRVGVEDPGYPDARNIFLAQNAAIAALSVDAEGLPVDERLDDLDYLYVTPSHQFPTTVTLPLERREALLAKAREKDFVIIEDDYECEANFVSGPAPALKALDRDARVIYVGSLSKSLSPGIRLGYLVGPAELIAEARRLRYLMLRHAPTIVQRTAALFISQGHHDALIHRMARIYRERWEKMEGALARHLPLSYRTPTFGGTSYWVQGPGGMDANRLMMRALEQGVIIESGRSYFFSENGPKNFFRLSFSVIPADKIEPGVHILADLIGKQAQ